MSAPKLFSWLRHGQVPANWLRSRPLNLVIGLLLACAWGLFCYAHLRAFLTSGDWSCLMFAVSESLVATLFLIRSAPQRVSTDPSDWAIALGAMAAPFLFTPSGDGWLPAARLLILISTTIQVAGLLTLNRSFGLVAAHREIKTRGLYGVVRHPLYASYLLSYSGYLLVNTSAFNLLVATLASTLLLCRLLREERFLARDPRYVEYMQQVKFRVIPRLF